MEALEFTEEMTGMVEQMPIKYIKAYLEQVINPKKDCQMIMNQRLRQLIIMVK